jgi:hypothetical protein
MTGDGLNKADRYFIVFLLLALSVFALHFFSFTVFEGFSTLSNDSFSFIRMARNWSIFSEPAAYNLQTLPEHLRAPVFPWLLSITGGAESTYAAHLLVSVAMLTGIALLGWIVYRHAGWLVGGLTAIAICLLPGIIISSLGILTENPYLVLSLAVIMSAMYVRKTPDCHPGWLLLLLVSLSLAILTRTVGVALAASLITVAVFDRKTTRKTSIIFLVVAGLAVVTWQMWNVIGADDRVNRQMEFLMPIFGSSEQPLTERLAFLQALIMGNISRLIGSWNHYLNLTNDGIWFFLTSFVFLAPCLIALILRAVRLKIDALYICFYLAIVVIWPFPEALVRFLHPVIPILLIQPLLLIPGKDFAEGWTPKKIAAIAVILLLIVNSLLVQRELIRWKNEAELSYPSLVHSFEYYDNRDRQEALRASSAFQDIIELMKSSAQVIPEGSVVATVKNEAYMLLAGREAIFLSTLVPYHQQLCNFQIKKADYIFLTSLFSDFTPRPFELVEKYKEITAFEMSTNDSNGEPLSYILKLDMSAIESILEEAGFQCSVYKIRTI